MIRCIVLASEDITANYRSAPGAQDRLSSLQSDFSQFCDIKLLINPPPNSPSNAAAIGVNIDLHCAAPPKTGRIHTSTCSLTSTQSGPHRLVSPWSIPPITTLHSSRHGRGMLGKIRPLQKMCRCRFWCVCVFVRAHPCM